MKKHIYILFALLISLSCFSQTWTVHAVKENCTALYFRGMPLQSGGYTWYQWYGTMQFDWDWDQIYPQYSDSGVEIFTFNGTDGYNKTTDFNGWSETMTFSAPSEAEDASWYLFGGAPDYGGEEWNLGGSLSLTGGEFWIDFGPASIARVSESKPSDFGKWSWDGSINPSWVEPAGKGRGHVKKHGAVKRP